MNTINTAESVAGELPKSVRGAPAELRRLIRKRQNSESAKRCRLRRKLEAAKESGTQLTTAERLENLEKIVAQLNEKLYQTDNTIAKLLSQNRNPPPAPLMAPHVLSHASPMHHVVQQSQQAATPVMPNLVLPAFPVFSFSDDLPISPVTPTSPRAALQIPEVAPDSPPSQRSMSDTDDFIAPTQDANAEKCVPKEEFFEVGSPASEFEFVSPDVSLNNFSSDDDLFASLEICTADNVM